MSWRSGNLGIVRRVETLARTDRATIEPRVVIQTRAPAFEVYDVDADGLECFLGYLEDRPEPEQTDLRAAVLIDARGFA